MSAPLQALVAMSHALADPALDAVILGEGNTSCRAGDGTFFVKGSGCQLGSIRPEQFALLRTDRLLPLFEREDASQAELDAAYRAALDPASPPVRPSVETLFHAACLALPGVEVVAHTHPAAVNALTCCVNFPRVLEGRMFPDEAVVLGSHSVCIPYLDPGFTLAKAIREAVHNHLRYHGRAPKTVYLQNHGLIALAANPTEALNITAMAIKAARIRLGALAGGGIHRLPEGEVGHIVNRPDEVYRAKVLTGG